MLLVKILLLNYKLFDVKLVFGTKIISSQQAPELKSQCLKETLPSNVGYKS